MKNGWILIYRPPIENINYDNIITLPKVFYIDKYECPEELDLKIKIDFLKKTYRMKDEYITIENLTEYHFDKK